MNATTDLPRSESDYGARFHRRLGVLPGILFSRIRGALLPGGDDSTIGQDLRCLIARGERYPRDLLLHLLDREPRRGGLARPVGGQIRGLHGDGNPGDWVPFLYGPTRRGWIPRTAVARCGLRLCVHGGGVSRLPRLAGAASGNRYRRHAVRGHARRHGRSARGRPLDRRRARNPSILGSRGRGRAPGGDRSVVDHAEGNTSHIAGKSERWSSCHVQNRVLQSAVLPLRPCRRVAVCPDDDRGHGLGRALFRDG